MDRRARILTQALAVALIVVAGVGAYTYTLQNRLDATLESVGALEQDRNIWKSKAERAEGVIDTASASLNTCSAEVETLRAQLVWAPPVSRAPGF